VKHIWFRAVRYIDVVNIEEFERQNAEEGQLNQRQRVTDEGQQNSIYPSRYFRYQIVAKLDCEETQLFVIRLVETV
jgi:hypothetical protein